MARATRRQVAVGPSDEAQEATILMVGLAGGNVSSVIENAERAGQRALVAEAVLPRRSDGALRGSPPKAGALVDWADQAPPDLAVLAAADDLFVRVRLPKGWTKRGSDHAMWSHLLDAQGRERAAIFYKAAFYDRDAFLSWGQRYRVAQVFLPTPAAPTEVRVEVQDARTNDSDGATLHVVATFARYDRSAEADAPNGISTYMAREEQARADARAWLEARRPNWRDPRAYWDDVEAPKP